MKLRIHDQSIRFRLSQLDVENFKQVGELRHEIKLSVKSDALFKIRLRRCGPQSKAYMDVDTLCVDIADDKCQNFHKPGVITVEDKINIPKGDYLHILIEKDFGCLKNRTGLDDIDTFPNPFSDIAVC